MQSERSGSYKKMLHGELAYSSFVPTPLPPKPSIEVSEEMLKLLATAHHLLGKLDGISVTLIDVDFFIAMYVRKEALLSSQIEGTQASLDDILDPYIEENTNLDVTEVVNYIKATDYAMNRLQQLPICNRLLREMHEILMNSVRGQEKNPGEFRRSQNWIGPAGGNLKNAVFIPPNVDDMVQAMNDLELFIHADDEMDLLIKIGLVHYQFETIHPFLDGNGRLGRMLITLWLMERDILRYPVLYISYYLKRNRMEYYDRLNETRRKGNYEAWIGFFLQAMIDSARDAMETIQLVHQLNLENEAKIQTLSNRKVNALRLFRTIQRQPIIDISKTAQQWGVQYNTVAKAVDQLVQLSILEQVDTKKRNRQFVYAKYLDILRKDTEM
jgi:Fic family protein